MAEERIVITVREDGSRVVSRNLREIGTSARSSTPHVLSLNQALGALGATLAVDKVRRWLDTWTSAKGKVNIFTKSVEETNMVLDKLVNVAQDTRQPLDATVNSFHQLTLASSALGASQNDILSVTASVNKVFAIQGTTAQTARGGIIQFGQAMTEGIVRAQEYNSMINAMPLLLKVVAQNLDGAGGSVAKLRKMMLDGKLMSKDFFKAIKDGEPMIKLLFDRSGKTIGQAFTILDNAMTQYVGKLDTAIGFSQGFFKVAQFLATNIQHVANALIAIGSPLVIRGLWGVVAALNAMRIAAIANPLLTIAAATIAALTALALYKDQIMILKDEQVSLGDYAKASWDVIIEGATAAGAWIGDTFGGAVTKAINYLTGLNLTWDDISANLRKAINLWIGWFVALPKLFIEVWSNVPGALANIFITAFNSIKGQAADLINGMIDAINPILKKANFGEMAQVSFQQSEVKIVDSWAKMAGDMDAIIRESTKTDYVGAAIEGFDKLSDRARVYAEQRKADAIKQAETERQLAKLMAQGSEPDDFSGGKKKKGPKGEFDNPRSLENNLRRLLNTISPLNGATLEYERAQRILNAAQAAGMITAEDHVKYLELVKNHYRDIVDPIGAVNRELQRETEYLGLNSKERSVAIQMYQIQEDLRKQGIFTTSAETAAIKEQLIALENLQALTAARDALYQSTAGALDDIVNKQTALTEAFSAGAITQEYYTSQLARTNVEWATLQNQMGNGDQFTIMTEAAGQALESFVSMATSIASVMGNVMTTAIDGVANSLARAIVFGDNLRDSLHQVASTILVEMISALIKMGIQYAINATIGQAAATAAAGASIAMAGAVAAAWAPAAAATSLASFGANSGPAVMGMAAANVAAKSFALASFDGGGYTGSDPRTGGLDGKGGFLALMHPQETVTDHTKGQKVPEDSAQQGERPISMTFNLHGVQDADSFKRSEGQIRARMARGLKRAETRNT